MFKKLILACAFCLGTMTLAEQTASAGGCGYDSYSAGYGAYGYGGYDYVPSVSVVRSYSVYRPAYRPVPIHHHVRPYRPAPYSAYRYGYGVKRRSYGYGYGYRSARPYSRGGISIGIGF